MLAVEREDDAADGEIARVSLVRGDGVQERAHGARRERIAARTGGHRAAPEELPHHDARRACERGSRPPPCGVGDVLALDERCGVTNQSSGLAELLCGRGSASGGVRPQTYELGHDPRPQGRAQTRGVLVGRILRPRLLGELAHAAKVRPLDAQGRADETDVRAGSECPAWGRCGETVETRAAQQGHEHRLELVLRVVSRRDRGTRVAHRDRFKGSIALGAGGGLEVEVPWDVDLDALEGKAETCGETGGDAGVVGGLLARTEVVEHVAHDEDV